MASETTPDFEGDIGQLLDLVGRSRVEVRPGAGSTLAALTDLIDRWNKVVNLISRKDIGRLVCYHFCDSASLLPILRPGRDMAMLDIGGSNGLPGMVLAAISPYLRVTICDSRRKRRVFLDEARAGLDIPVEYEIGRADSAEFRSKYVEGFDLIVARAVTRLKQLLKWCLPLLRPGGYLVAYKGSRCLDEVRQAEPVFFRHGGRLLTVMGSPWADLCNPYRLFAVAGKADN